MVFKHTSVLLEETVDGLNIKPDGIYVDGTLGGGGHAYEVCTRLGNKGRFIGIDQDEAAIEALIAKQREEIEAQLRAKLLAEMQATVSQTKAEEKDE